MDPIKAPWSPELVYKLNKRQKDPHVHPYTCGGEGRNDMRIHGDGEGVLVATINGWICPYCAYTQDWC